MAESTESSSFPLTLHQVPNGLVVLLAVALLLQGPVGAFEAFRDYTVDLAGAIFGGEKLYRQVLGQTAPLAFAFAAITFLTRGGWLTWTDSTSIVVVGILVLGATWVGGNLRETVSRRSVVSSAAPKGIPDSVRGKAVLGAVDDRLSSESSPDDVIPVSVAVTRLIDFDAAADEDSSQRWSDPVPRVALLPEPGSVVGIVARALNQLFGYLVAYGPRLFLAASLVGIYIGWTWYPIYQRLVGWFRSRAAQPAEA